MFLLLIEEVANQVMTPPKVANPPDMAAAVTDSPNTLSSCKNLKSTLILYFKSLIMMRTRSKISLYFDPYIKCNCYCNPKIW